MKRKILFFAVMLTFVCCFLALGVSAAATNEFGTVETIPSIDLTGMNTDTVARVVLVDASGEFHTYPTRYILSENTKFKYNFKPINDALSASYDKHSVIRIEVPDNITIAANCGDLSQTKELLEIKFFPTSELHTLEYGCFYANKKLQKLNIPKKVTTIGTLIVNNSHLEELVFDDGFCAVLPKDSFKGASGVKKVVFSNQMTTIEDRAMDSTLGEKLQEFYMGAGLKNLGTNNMAWVKQSVKFYIPAQFLSEAETITMETFSWWSSSACLPTGVIFFTGTRAQAEALIAKSTYDRVFCQTAELVEWDSKVEDSAYVPKNGWKIVYNYGVCNAFYGGDHQLAGEVKANVKDFMSEITIGDVCTRQGCGLGITEKVIAPIFKVLGYSMSENPGANGAYSIVRGYKINWKAYNDYLEYGSLAFGVVASSVDVTGKEPLTVSNGTVSAVNLDKTIVVSQNIFNGFDCMEIKINGLKEDHIGQELVMTVYVYDGKSISYLNDTIVVNIPSA